MWDDATEAAMKDLVTGLRENSDMPLGLQLGHAGRKASCAAPWQGGAQIAQSAGGWQTIAPSAVAFTEGTEAPQAMSLERIAELKKAYVDTVRRADRLGFLFAGTARRSRLSAAPVPVTTFKPAHRPVRRLTGKPYAPAAGDLREIRAAFPAEKPIGVRISATDWVEGGWDLEQSIELAKALDELGCSYIHVSSGGLSPHQKITVGPNYQVPFADGIKRYVKMPVIAVV